MSSASTDRGGVWALAWGFALAIWSIAASALAQDASPISPDGGWCWFADPRAIIVGDVLYTGWVTHVGDIEVTASTSDGHHANAVLHEKFQADDHANPSFLALPDGRVMAFYSQHGGPDLFSSTTVSPGGLGTWTPSRRLSLQGAPAPEGHATPDGYCYPNPCWLAASRTIALTWRELNWKPTVAFSSDLGATWTPGRMLFSEAASRPSNRPYVKVCSDGVGRVHYVVTDGHPRDEPTNSIYHFYFEGDAFYRMDGTRIATIATLPIRPDQCDVVYDGRSEGVRSWVWDVALDAAHRPMVTYARLPRTDAHEYRYAAWNGFRWVDRRICEAGGWFPRTPDGKVEPEPHYSGGVVLDHDDPSVVYLSRPVAGRFGIERWLTPDGGDHWSSLRLTEADGLDRVRPVVARGRWRGQRVVLWMQNRRYRHYTDYDSGIAIRVEAAPPREPFTKPEIARLAAAVARWQLQAGTSYRLTDWTVAPFLAGLLAVSRTPGMPDFRGAVRDFAGRAQWKLGPRPFMADDHAVGQAYLELYLETHDPAMLAACAEAGQAMLAQSFDRSLKFEKGIQDHEWAWCDALFMSPPMLARLGAATNDRRWFDLLDRLWWKTTGYLYDPAEHLFFRDSRYFDRREPNGAKVFWSRGNGWVLAGLARVLEYLPADHVDRPRFEALFREMAERIRGLQREDGTWPPGLLAPAAYPQPETSGTGFFCYALAYGVRARLLERGAFQPAVERAFGALARAVDENGRLGFVQPVGESPQRIKPTDTDIFGSGAFLLAASEVYLLAPERGNVR